MPSALVPLANLTLTGSQASVTFSSVSGSYRDLLLVVNATITNIGGGSAGLLMRFNGDTTSTNTGVKMRGNGSATNSTTDTAQSYMYPASDDYAGLDHLSPQTTIINIMDYSATDKHKTVLSRGNKSNIGTEAFAGRWASTSAITTILLLPGGGSFVAGSSFALYGVSA